MPLIQWDDSLSVGVAAYDQAHQKLIAMINNLNDAMRKGQGKEVMASIVAGLASYTKVHFSDEERQFDRLGYPDVASHKQKHAQFVARLSEFQDGLKSNRIGLSIEVMNFLSDWLRDHIKVVDKAYAPFFNERGIK